MLLNHKDAIEFMVNGVPTEGITVPLVVDLQAKLMTDFLKDPRDIGSISRRVVNIDGSAYSPSNVPTLLEEALKVHRRQSPPHRQPGRGCVLHVGQRGLPAALC